MYMSKNKDKGIAIIRSAGVSPFGPHKVKDKDFWSVQVFRQVAIENEVGDHNVTDTELLKDLITNEKFNITSKFCNRSYTWSIKANVSFSDSLPLPKTHKISKKLGIFTSTPTKEVLEEDDLYGKHKHKENS